MSVRVIERTQRQSPTLVSIRAVREQPEVAEKDVNVRPIRHRRRRRWSVGGLIRLLALPRRLPPPQDFAAHAIERNGEQSLAFVRRDENMIAGDHRRGVSRRQRRSPHAGPHIEPLRQSLRWGYSGSVRPAELSPVRSGHHHRNQQPAEPQHGAYFTSVAGFANFASSKETLLFTSAI